MTFAQTLQRIRAFYCHDCCWPYSLAFLLTLIIYWLDLFRGSFPLHWPSAAAFTILFAYYLYNLYLARQGRLKNNRDGFFLWFLSFKIAVWGLLIFLLYI